MPLNYSECFLYDSKWLIGLSEYTLRLDPSCSSATICHSPPQNWQINCMAVDGQDQVWDKAEYICENNSIDVRVCTWIAECMHVAIWWHDMTSYSTSFSGLIRYSDADSVKKTSESGLLAKLIGQDDLGSLFVKCRPIKITVYGI